MLRKLLIAIICSIVAGNAGAADRESFGRSMKFRDHVVAKRLSVNPPPQSTSGTTNCDDGSVRCVSSTDGTVNIETFDAGSIRLPANSANSLLCAVSDHAYHYSLRNKTTSTTPGYVVITEHYTLESPYLEDPSLINPKTGAAFGGKIVMSSLVFQHSETLQAATSATQTQTFSSGAACTPNWFSRQSLRSSYGLSSSLARQVIAGPLTFRIGYTVTGRSVESLLFATSVRLLSD
jgi:hypothetical protein